MIGKRQLRGKDYKFHLPRASLSIVGEGFIDRGIRLMNMLLDFNIRMEQSTEQFRAKSRKWVATNIKAKPSRTK